jgi:hypothetical protein
MMFSPTLSSDRFRFLNCGYSVLLARTEGVKRAQAERKEIALFIERDIMG